MRKMSLLMIALCAATVLCVSSGCKAETEPKQNVNDAAIEYISNKYGLEFRYAGPTGDSMSGTHSCLARCDEIDYPILVSVRDYSSDAPVFSDNYHAVLYQEETRQFFADCAKLVTGQAETSYSPIRLGYECFQDADVSFEEFLRDGDVRLHITIKIRDCEGSSDADLEEIANAAASGCSNFSLLMAVLPPEVYDETPLEDTGYLITRREFVRCAQATNNNGELTMLWYEKN